MTPGSPEAVKKGCICPVLDNAHGAGVKGKFYTNSNCPVHKERSERFDLPIQVFFIIGIPATAVFLALFAKLLTLI